MKIIFAAFLFDKFECMWESISSYDCMVQWVQKIALKIDWNISKINNMRKRGEILADCNRSRIIAVTS